MIRTVLNGIRRAAASRAGDGRVLVGLGIIFVFVLGVILLTSSDFVSSVTRDLRKTEAELLAARRRAAEAEQEAAKADQELRHVGAELVKLREGEQSAGQPAEAQPVPDATPAQVPEPKGPEALAAGLTADQVKGILGEPRQTMVMGGGERAIEIWKYDGGDVRFVNGALEKWDVGAGKTGLSAAVPSLAAACDAFGRTYGLLWKDRIAVHEFGGSCYAHIPLSLPWFVAEDVCEALGGRLASITSAEEQQFVFHTVESDGGGVWIGLTDYANEGDWRWVGGEAKGFVNWLPGEPNNKGGAQNWAVLTTNGGKWEDAAAGARWPFVCEWRPPQQAGGKARVFAQRPLSFYAETCVRLSAMTEVQRAAYGDFLRGHFVQTDGWILDVKNKDKNDLVVLSAFESSPDAVLNLLCPGGSATRLQKGQRISFRARMDTVEKATTGASVFHMTLVRFGN